MNWRKETEKRMGKDTVYRQDAIDALGERPLVWTDDDQYALGERNQYDRDRLAIGTLPSAQKTNGLTLKNSLSGGKMMSEYIVKETGYPGTIKQEIVQELVRCRDCEHWRDGNSIISDEPYCEVDAIRWPEDHFCGAGERKKK